MDTINSNFKSLGAKSNEPAQILEILITTDNHMGYKEKDPILGEDSFTAFEECLEIANRRDVDFVLLGGDLFHD